MHGVERLAARGEPADMLVAVPGGPADLASARRHVSGPIYWSAAGSDAARCTAPRDRWDHFLAPGAGPLRGGGFFALRTLGGVAGFTLKLGAGWCWAEGFCFAIAADDATSRASERPRVFGILIRLHLHAV